LSSGLFGFTPLNFRHDSIADELGAV